MKKKQVFAALVAVIVVATALPASAATEVVTPRNSAGWSFTKSTLAGETTSYVRFRGGPQVPPAGGGSLEFGVGSNIDSYAETSTSRYNGSQLASITNLDYSTFIETTTTPSAVRLEIGIDRAGGTARSDELVFDPACNVTTGVTPPPGGSSGPGPTANSWQTWDADDGLWYLRDPITGNQPQPATPPNAPACGETTFHFKAFQIAFPQSRIVSRRTTPGGVALSFGRNAADLPQYTAGAKAAADRLVFTSSAPPGGTGFDDLWDFDPDIVSVFADAPEGWSTMTFNPAAPTSNTASVAFEAGPATPPFGAGSLRLTVGANGDSVAEARHRFFDGAKVSDIGSPTVFPVGALGYSTYVRSSPGDATNAPYLLLDVDLDGSSTTTADRTQLRFQPKSNGTVSLNTWQRWDAASGTWQRSDTNAAVLLSNPALTNAVVFNPADGLGGLHVSAGGGSARSGQSAATWSGFDGNVDGVTTELAVPINTENQARAARTYSFEAGNSPTVTTVPPTGGGTPTSTTSTTFCCQQTTTTTADPNATTTTTTTSPPGGTTTTTTPPGGTTTTTTSPGNTTTTTQPAGTSVQRVAGGDRFTTAIEVSKRSYSDQGAGSVVIARAENYPDALAASPLASSTRGPILLTLPGDLEARTRAEVARVLPRGRTVFLVGGLAALSANIETTLRADGYNVTRFAGRNRFETATLVAESMPTATAAMLVTGDNFPDALSAGAAASDVRGVVLLTNGRGMPAETSAYLRARPNMPRYAIGGAAAAADPGATPIVGVDRFETAVNVATRFFPSPRTAGIASGLNYPDALAGGPHVGTRNGPILLTRFDSLPTNVREYLSARKSSLRDVFIYGGTSTVSQQVEADAQASVR